MKKRILCLLLALAVVLSVLPLTAFAEPAETVPEKYRGKYKGYESGYLIVIEIFEDRGYYTVEQYLDDGTLIFESSEYNEQTHEFKMTFEPVTHHGKLHLAFKDGEEEFCSGEFFHSGGVIMFSNLKKVSDSTGSTLSAGSSLIIPIAAAVLLIGAVIFIGKRKKEITE